LRVLPTTIEETESSEDEVHDESTDSEHTTVGNETIGRDLLDKALKDLASRVEDWKNLDVNSLGNLLLHGVYYIVRETPKEVSIQPICSLVIMLV
jgi:hypothetical protein